MKKSVFLHKYISGNVSFRDKYIYITLCYLLLHKYKKCVNEEMSSKWERSPKIYLEKIQKHGTA